MSSFTLNWQYTSSFWQTFLLVHHVLSTPWVHQIHETDRALFGRAIFQSTLNLLNFVCSVIAFSENRYTFCFLPSWIACCFSADNALYMSEWVWERDARVQSQLSNGFSDLAFSLKHRSTFCQLSSLSLSLSDVPELNWICFSLVDMAPHGNGVFVRKCYRCHVYNKLYCRRETSLISPLHLYILVHQLVATNLISHISGFISLTISLARFCLIAFIFNSGTQFASVAPIVHH